MRDKSTMSVGFDDDGTCRNCGHNDCTEDHDSQAARIQELEGLVDRRTAQRDAMSDMRDAHVVKIEELETSAKECNAALTRTAILVSRILGRVVSETEVLSEAEALLTALAEESVTGHAQASLAYAAMKARAEHAEALLRIAIPVVTRELNNAVVKDAYSLLRAIENMFRG